MKGGFAHLNDLGDKMEQAHRDLKLLKRFDFAFMIVAVIIMAGLLYIGSQTASLASIGKHVDQVVDRLDNHEGRISKLENWHN